MLSIIFILLVGINREFVKEKKGSEHRFIESLSDDLITNVCVRGMCLDLCVGVHVRVCECLRHHKIR